MTQTGEDNPRPLYNNSPGIAPAERPPGLVDVMETGSVEKKQTRKPKKSTLNRIDEPASESRIWGNMDTAQNDPSLKIQANSRHHWWVKQYKVESEGAYKGNIVADTAGLQSFNKEYWYMNVTIQTNKGRITTFKKNGWEFDILHDPTKVRIKHAEGIFELIAIGNNIVHAKDENGKVDIPLNEIEFITLT